MHVVGVEFWNKKYLYKDHAMQSLLPAWENYVKIGSAVLINSHTDRHISFIYLYGLCNI